MQRVVRYLIRKITRRAGATTKRLKGFLDLPNELIYIIADNLENEDLSRLLRTNRFLARILSPDLLARAVYSNGGPARYNRSVLHWGAEYNRKDLVTNILKLGGASRINILDRTGNTPLHSAIIVRHGDIVKLLLENGAGIETRNGCMWTPLLCAAYIGNDIAGRILLEHGASIEALDIRGGTALDLATRFGHVAMAELLLERGSTKPSGNSVGIGLRPVRHRWLMAWMGF